MKIKMNLSGHCIETEAKRLYNNSITEFFENSESTDSELEEKIEGLKSFLEYTDFAHLRGRHPVLAGTEEGKAILNLLGENLFELEVNESIYRAQKKDR
ncbi:MAG: hypothetical protein KKC46_19985 [Proteobacteria bacterium]|nr:hypothetical protein [Pseudomonadota bacterium]